jgi:hypothetical protein
MDEVGNVFQVHYHSGWAYMAGYAQHLFQLQHDTQHIVTERLCRLVGYAKKVKGLTQEISCKAQEVSFHRSSKHDQELLRHHVLLRTTEESTKIKAREFEEYQTAKDLEIQGMQEELEELEEKVHDRGVALATRDNIIDNLQAEILKL